MKFITFLLLLALSLVFAMRANAIDGALAGSQSDIISRSSVGVLAGATDFSNTLTSDWTMHLAGGFAYHLDATPHFGIEADALYTNKDVASAGSFRYLTIPILAEYRASPIGPNAKITSHLGTGPEFNINTYGPDTASTSVFAWDFDAGVDASVKERTELTFDFRFAQGLTSTVTYFMLRTTEVYFLAGIRFRID